MIKPRALKKGDIIGIIAPSGIASEESIYKSKRTMESWGYKVRFGRSCFSKHGYLSGEDSLRAFDLNNMFQDDSIAGIICLRGGFGATKILDYINYDMIKKTPKIFVGFSDITALHIALNQRCKLTTLHGPMAVNIGDGLEDYSRECLIKAITQPRPLGLISNPATTPIEILVEGEATGAITGGNLTMITATLGTPYEIDTRGKLLLIEEIGEEPYRVDRMLTQLAQAGKLKEASGFIIGDFKNCEAKKPSEGLCIQNIFQEIILSLRKPTIGKLKIGHCIPNITVPLGVKAYINASEGQLIIEESATIQ